MNVCGFAIEVSAVTGPTLPSHAPSRSDEARGALITALAAVARRDRDALRQVYDLTSAKLFGICLRICGDRGSAEDVLQAVYMKVWDRADRFDPARSSPITWLCTIARNGAIDWRRSASGKAALAPSLPASAAMEVADTAPRADILLETAEDGERLHHCLDELEARSHAAVRAAFFDGLTYAELAERNEVPLGTMKSLIRRAMLRLKDCMRDG